VIAKHTSDIFDHKTGNTKQLNSKEKDKSSSIVQLAQPLYTNQNIINGLKQGQADAASEFILRFGKKINCLVWRFLGTDQEHDDVVQQVLVNILNSIRKLKNEKSLEAWVVRVTINTVRKEIRTRKRRRLDYCLPEQLDRIGSAQSPDQRIMLRFYNIVEQMKTEDRIVFILHELEGYGLVEISLVIKCSLATIKRRLLRARNYFATAAQQDTLLSDFV